MTKFGNFKRIRWVIGYWCDDIFGYEEAVVYSKKALKDKLSKGYIFIREEKEPYRAA